MSLTESIKDILIPKETYIKVYHDVYRILIKDSLRSSVISFLAKPIQEARDVVEYAADTIPICSQIYDSHSYYPNNGQSFFDAVKKGKVYGIIDTLSCGKGYSLTILKRCYNNCIDVSIPILFCSCCYSEECNFEKLEEKSKCFKREVVSIYMPRSHPLNIRRPTDCVSLDQE